MQRVRRHFAADANCSVCHSAVKDVHHVLRGCSRSMMVWAAFVRPDWLADYLSLDLVTWMTVNLSDDSHFGIQTKEWDILFGTLIWHIWLDRNNHVFNDCSCDPNSTIARSTKVQRLCCSARQEARRGGSTMQSSTIGNVGLVKWNRHVVGWYCFI
ncbi:hypothetical protein F3Y22_tig00110833pilonHSYRG00052 [Hibiscus syriacus]|uniref:Reverse transcriptase zinc-binding domain-containing protein n=1 Tax=Hibiscus syriacus TaxID=106335 RepID=A0A6A2ZKK5_HIBSY|nr:hypothetical protein F3Y22_tig00110833pilonHSYRG00052 [Hibiscus syriacus]